MAYIKPDRSDNFNIDEARCASLGRTHRPRKNHGPSAYGKGSRPCRQTKAEEKRYNDNFADLDWNNYPEEERCPASGVANAPID